MANKISLIKLTLIQISLLPANLKNFLDSINPGDILMSSDGSKAIDINVGIRFVIYQLGRQIQSGHQSLAKNLEFYNVEVHAAPM